MNPFRWIKKVLFPPVEPTGRFQKSPEELAASIGEIDERSLSELTRLSESTFNEPHQRADAAERRATTLLSAAGIAGGLSLAGVGLLLDPQKVPETWMKLVLGFLLSLVIACFTMAALRSLAALKVMKWSGPNYEDLLPSSKEEKGNSELLRACHLLHLSARNEGNARWKIAQARAATEWFTRAVAFLFITFLFGIALAIFVEPSATRVISPGDHQGCRPDRHCGPNQ